MLQVERLDRAARRRAPPGVEEWIEDLDGDADVAEGAVAVALRNAKVRRQRVEATPAKLGEQAARQLERAEMIGLDSAAPRAAAPRR